MKWDVCMVEDCDKAAFSAGIASLLSEGWSLNAWHTTYVGRDDNHEPWVIFTAMLTKHEKTPLAAI
jgi:high-affinity Fe2+/Pb2+ permease